MDDLLPKLLSFPPHPLPKTPLSNKQYDEGMAAQIDVLQKTSTKHLSQRTSGGESPLEVRLIAWKLLLLSDRSAGHKSRIALRSLCPRLNIPHQRFREGNRHRSAQALAVLYGVFNELRHKADQIRWPGTLWNRWLHSICCTAESPGTAAEITCDLFDI